MTATVHSLQQLMCGLRGHDDVLCFERCRLALKCLSCGHESTGWILPADDHRAERTAPAPPTGLAYGKRHAPSVQ